MTSKLDKVKELQVEFHIKTNISIEEKMSELRHWWSLLFQSWNTNTSSFSKLRHLKLCIFVCCLILAPRCTFIVTQLWILLWAQTAMNLNTLQNPEKGSSWTTEMHTINGISPMQMRGFLYILQSECDFYSYRQPTHTYLLLLSKVWI